MWQLTTTIAKLAEDPRPVGARKLRNVEDTWRIRVGGYRICYAVEQDRLIILILAVARRGDVYERLRRRLV